MTTPPYPSLVDWIATHARDQEPTPPRWAHRSSPAGWAVPPRVRARLEAAIEAVSEVQRAEWLTSGVWLGPRTFPDLYDDLLHACRTLQAPIPSAIVGPASSRGQLVGGTDAHPTLYLSGFFHQHAARAERRFVLGRLVGQIADRQVSWRTLYNLTGPDAELRSLAARALGPASTLLLEPAGLVLRASLARWVQRAELSADRAGLLCCEDPDAAASALFRQALLTRHAVRAEDAIAEARRSTKGHGAAKWAELLTDEPALYKRLLALDLFTRSACWLGDEALQLGTPLDDVQLAEAVDALLEGE
jgi:hypothetical protein